MSIQSRVDLSERGHQKPILEALSLSPQSDASHSSSDLRDGLDCGRELRPRSINHLVGFCRVMPCRCVAFPGRDYVQNPGMKMEIALMKLKSWKSENGKRNGG